MGGSKHPASKLKPYEARFVLSLSMFILGGTSEFQNMVFTWTTIRHSPKMLGMIFASRVCLLAGEQETFHYTTERKSSRLPATAVPVLKLYYKKTKIQPAAGEGRSSTKVVLPENENPAGRRRRRSSAKVVLAENENPAGRRRRPFQY